MMVASQGTIMVARMHMNTKLRPLNSRNEKEKAAMEQVIICKMVTEPATIKELRMNFPRET